MGAQGRSQERHPMEIEYEVNQNNILVVSRAP
jgi:hypothetical protein